MGDIGYDTDIGRTLYDELNEITETLQIFFNHFQSIISVGWWRSRREETKEKLLKEKSTWKYSATDAHDVRELLLELTGSEEHSFSLMFYGAFYLFRRGLHEDAFTVYQECLNFEAIPSVDKGLIRENIATFHRRNGRSKLMIGEMKKALDYFIESGEQYRIGVALKNLGEAEWMYGKRDAAIRYFKEAEELGDTLDQEEKFGVLWNLASSARRIGNTEMEIEYLSKSLVECPDEYPERIIAIDRRLDELTWF